MADDNPFSGLDSLLISSSPRVDKPSQKDPPGSKTANKSRKLGAKKTQTSISTPQSGRSIESTKSVNQSGQPIDSTNRQNQSTQSVKKTNPVNSSIDRSIDPSIGQLVGEVVKRPLAFYIPVATNEKLEEAVRYYQKKYHRKIDRSAVVSAILGDLSLWEPQNLDQLAPKVTAQLKNRLQEHLASRLAESTD